MNRLAFCCLLFAISGLAWAAGGRSPELPRDASARISSDMSLNAVKWEGGFWQDRMRRLREIYLPGTLDGSFMDLANGSSLRNLLRATGVEQGGALGRSWSDGDCYFLLDVASRLYAQQPDEYLQKKLDDWISMIGKVQRDDGLVDTWTILKDFDTASAKNWERFEKQSANRGHLAGGHQYNLGHLYKAAMSHQRATGQDALMRIADKYLLYYLDRAEQGGAASRGYSITPQVAYACALRYARTGEERFLNAMRRAYGSQPTPFGPPLREATQIFGHNTQTAHTLIGAAMLCGFTGEPALLEVLRRLMDNLLSSKVFITGAVAPVQAGNRPEQTVSGRTYPKERIAEAVGEEFDLPNDTAYCESCGQCLYMELLYRMFLLTGEGKYMDAAERSLYNSVPGCVDLDRPKFFYANPQEQGPTSRRRRELEPETGWNLAHYTWRRTYTKNTACCPPKVLRALALANEIAYSASKEGLWVNLYGDNSLKVTLPAVGAVECRQTSNYPWNGSVKLALTKVSSEKPFAVLLRIPGWVEGAVPVSINGTILPEPGATGAYLRIEQAWKSGDRIEFELPMPVRLMAADPRIKDARGKVAVMRGPVVYCLEGDDVPDGVAIEQVRVPATADFKPAFVQELGGVSKLTGNVVCTPAVAGKEGRLVWDESRTTLYARARFAGQAPVAGQGDRAIAVSLIPYYARLNRKSDYFRVWLPVY